MDPRAIFDWLVAGAPGAGAMADVIGRLSEMLLEAGVPLWRAAVFEETLHFELKGIAQSQEVFAPPEGDPLARWELPPVPQLGGSGERDGSPR